MATEGKMTDDMMDMMYGFGDEWPPNPESVTMLENLVAEYIGNLASRALDVAEVTGKLDKECFMFLVRKDRLKFNRIQKLIKANEELKSVRDILLADDQQASEK